MFFWRVFWFLVLVGSAPWVRDFFFPLKLFIDQPPTEVYFTIFLIEATSEAPGTKLATGWNINDLALFLKPAATGLS